MPSLNLLSLYRNRASSSPPEPRTVTPQPRSSQSLSVASLSSPFERRIHPDLNALAAELSSDIPQSQPVQSENNNPLVSLTPWTRNRRNSSASATPAKTVNSNPTQVTPLDPILSDNAHESDGQTDTNSTPSSERPPSRANRILNRLTGLGAQPSPASSNPPSAWNTFGRRKSRRHSSIPHFSDFGASPDVSLSNSQRSRASSSQTSPPNPADTSADNSGSFSSHSLQSVSPSQTTHSRSQSHSHSLHTPPHPQPHSPPSSAFTFGSVGVPPLLTYPALRFSLFGEASEIAEGQNTSAGETKESDLAFELNFEPLSQPRPSKSMPSISHHQHLESISNDSFASGPAPSSRPRAQDIFPTSLSSDQLHRTPGNGTTGSSSNKRRAHLSPLVSGEISEAHTDNVEISDALGTPFRLQQGPEALGPSPADEPSNLLADANNSTHPPPQIRDKLKDPQNSSMVAGTTTPPRRTSSSLGGNGDERTSPKSRSKGKGKERDASRSSSGTSSPLRNVTLSSPTMMADFPTPPLPTSRPTTPLRSAMVSSSRPKSTGPSFEPIPLATSASGSSLGKGKRKVDEVDGGGEDSALTGTSLPPGKKKQLRTIHRATFAAEPRMHRTSTSSTYAASHYTRRKRARLSSGTSFATTHTVSENGVTRVPSRAGSYRHHVPYNNSSAQPPSRGSRTPTQSSLRAGSASSHHQHSVRYAGAVGQPQRVRAPSSTRGSSRRNSASVSQASIPISALISPHAPSISIHRSTAFHMRDPRKPTPVHPTSWSLAFPSAGPGERGYLAGCMDATKSSWGLRGRLFRSRRATKKEKGEKDLEKQANSERDEKLPIVDWIEGGGSPIHAWLFFLGFIVFPVWWIAGLLVGIPKTRRLGGGEKSVVLDDPQVEHDAKSWRTRCRVMAVISLFTYVPFIVLLAIFVPRT